MLLFYEDNYARRHLNEWWSEWSVRGRGVWDVHELNFFSASHLSCSVCKSVPNTTFGYCHLLGSSLISSCSSLMASRYCILTKGSCTSFVRRVFTFGSTNFSKKSMSVLQVSSAYLTTTRNRNKVSE